MLPDYQPSDSFVTRAIHYEITRVLSSTLSGAVYVVRHPFLDKRFIAKVISQELSGDSDICDRFLRGGRALAHLDGHPGIVTIVDLGITCGHSPVPYCIMEWLRGETLRTHLARKRGPLAPRDALKIAIEILRALAYAHERGVVHRDCKLENVILHDTVDRGRVTTLIDWFDLKILTALDEGTTAAGTLVGTRPNASPEQIEGGPITPATDLWSVAIVLFQMLTERHPVTQGLRHPGAVSAAILTRTPDRLSEHMKDVPDFLDDVVFASLSRDPTRRPRDAVALARVLESAIECFPLPKPDLNGATVEEPAPSERSPLEGNSSPSRSWVIGESPASPDDTQRTRTEPPRLHETPTVPVPPCKDGSNG